MTTLRAIYVIRYRPESTRGDHMLLVDAKMVRGFLVNACMCYFWYRFDTLEFPPRLARLADTSWKKTCVVRNAHMFLSGYMFICPNIKLGYHRHYNFQAQDMGHIVLNMVEGGNMCLTPKRNISFIKGQEKHLEPTCLTSQGDYFPHSGHIGTITDFREIRVYFPKRWLLRLEDHE